MYTCKLFFTFVVNFLNNNIKARQDYNWSWFVFLLQASAVKVPDNLVKALAGIVGDKNVSTAMAIREQHGKDESYHEFV